jgi:hypothetical protein
VHVIDDIDYFRRRAAQEHEAARHARGGSIRRVHLDLAARYAARIAEAEVLAAAPRMI